MRSCLIYGADRQAVSCAKSYSGRRESPSLVSAVETETERNQQHFSYVEASLELQHHNSSTYGRYSTHGSRRR